MRQFLTALFVNAMLGAAPSLAFDAGLAGMELRTRGLTIPYREFALSILPADRIDLQFNQPVSSASAGVSGSGVNWQWQAPILPGHHAIDFVGETGRMRLNMLVLRPASDLKNGYMDHYRIGRYQQLPLRGLAVYRAPRGFVQVEESMRDLRVSPNLTLGELLCKQTSAWPKFLVLREETLVKLEQLLALVNEKGIATDKFHIMSGYRTPWYNRQIGNRTSYSRHLYGGALDIFIDRAPRDGVMDDINGDGRIDRGDARYLADLIEQWSRSASAQLHGGLSVYSANAAHGPFVHIDTRGSRSRW